MRLIVGYFIFIAVVIAGLAGIGSQADAEENGVTSGVEQAVSPASAEPQALRIKSHTI